MFTRGMFFTNGSKNPGERVFLSDVLCLVKSSDYGNVAESTIRDRIVLGIRDDATRKKLLQTRKLDLSKSIDIIYAVRQA